MRSLIITVLIIFAAVFIVVVVASFFIFSAANKDRRVQVGLQESEGVVGLETYPAPEVVEPYIIVLEPTSVPDAIRGRTYEIRVSIEPRLQLSDGEDISGEEVLVSVDTDRGWLGFPQLDMYTGVPPFETVAHVTVSALAPIGAIGTVIFNVYNSQSSVQAASPVELTFTVSSAPRDPSFIWSHQPDNFVFIRGEQGASKELFIQGENTLSVPVTVFAICDRLCPFQFSSVDFPANFFGTKAISVTYNDPQLRFPNASYRGFDYAVVQGAETSGGNTFKQSGDLFFTVITEVDQSSPPVLPRRGKQR